MSEADPTPQQDRQRILVSLTWQNAVTLIMILFSIAGAYYKLQNSQNEVNARMSRLEQDIKDDKDRENQDVTKLQESQRRIWEFVSKPK